MATRITPTFLLRGLDPNKILADYQAGYFSRPVTNKTKITISRSNPILAPSYGTNNESPVFTLKDRNNSTVIIATSGHKNYEIFTRTGELKMGGRCDRCKRDFPHVAMGYVVGFLENSVLTNADPDPKKARYRILYTFWVEGEFCSIECAFSYATILLSHPVDYRDTTMRDSVRLLKFMYRLMYPNGPPLRPAQDPALLTGNGGSLTEEEWGDKRHIYKSTDRLLMIPTKREFIRENFTTATNYLP